MKKVLNFSLLVFAICIFNCGCLAGKKQVSSNSWKLGEKQVSSKPWKLDVDIYDKPGWNSFTYQFPLWGGIQKRANDEIVIRFDSADASGINDDFYYEHHRDVVLSSKDGGKSWEEIEPDWDHQIPLKLSDGTLIQVIQKRQLKENRQAQKARLQKLGLGHLWRDDCNLTWDLWPTAMADELKAKGMYPWEIVKVGASVCLPDGTIATNEPDLVVRRSTDGGETWQESELPEMNQFVHMGECFPGSIVLPDDTILVPFYASRKGTPGEFGKIVGYVIRSVDKGISWELITLPPHPASETALIYHPSGRVIATVRGVPILSMYSDDGGITWSTPQSTGVMGGHPHSAICLSSGNLLLTYAHRNFPAGTRATLSYDRGESWDVANEKILRDDVLPTSYIGGTGSVQLSDGTIFTFNSLVKVETPKPQDVLGRDNPLTFNPRFHCYIAGSIYTEDYVRPLGN